MGRKCVVPNCKGGYDNDVIRRSVFSFPACKQLTEKWLQLITRDRNTFKTRTSGVCESHFTEDDFLPKERTTKNGHAAKSRVRNKLKPFAIPSVFDVWSENIGDDRHQTQFSSHGFMKDQLHSQTQVSSSSQAQTILNADSIVLDDVSDLKSMIALLYDAIPPGLRLKRATHHHSLMASDVLMEGIEYVWLLRGNMNALDLKSYNPMKMFCCVNDNSNLEEDILDASVHNDSSTVSSVSVSIQNDFVASNNLKTDDNSISENLIQTKSTHIEYESEEDSNQSSVNNPIECCSVQTKIEDCNLDSPPSNSEENCLFPPPLVSVNMSEAITTSSVNSRSCVDQLLLKNNPFVSIPPEFVINERICPFNCTCDLHYVSTTHELTHTFYVSKLAAVLWDSPTFCKEHENNRDKLKSESMIQIQTFLISILKRLLRHHMFNFLRIYSCMPSFRNVEDVSNATGLTRVYYSQCEQRLPCVLLSKQQITEIMQDFQKYPQNFINKVAANENEFAVILLCKLFSLFRSTQFGEGSVSNKDEEKDLVLISRCECETYSNDRFTLADESEIHITPNIFCLNIWHYERRPIFYQALEMCWLKKDVESEEHEECGKSEESSASLCEPYEYNKGVSVNSKRTELIKSAKFRGRLSGLNNDDDVNTIDQFVKDHECEVRLIVDSSTTTDDGLQHSLRLICSKCGTPGSNFLPLRDASLSLMESSADPHAAAQNANDDLLIVVINEQTPATN